MIEIVMERWSLENICCDHRTLYHRRGDVYIHDCTPINGCNGYCGRRVWLNKEENAMVAESRYYRTRWRRSPYWSQKCRFFWWIGSKGKMSCGAPQRLGANSEMILWVGPRGMEQLWFRHPGTYLGSSICVLPLYYKRPGRKLVRSSSVRGQN